MGNSASTCVCRWIGCCGGEWVDPGRVAGPVGWWSGQLPVVRAGGFVICASWWSDGFVGGRVVRKGGWVEVSVWAGGQAQRMDNDDHTVLFWAVARLPPQRVQAHDLESIYLKSTQLIKQKHVKQNTNTDTRTNTSTDLDIRRSTQAHTHTTTQPNT